MLFFKNYCFIIIYYYYIATINIILNIIMHRVFSSCSEPGLLLLAVCRLLIAVASLGGGAWASVVTAPRLQSTGCSCGAQAQLPQGTWDPPGPGIEPTSPALTGRLLSAAPLGKLCCIFKNVHKIQVKFQEK